MVKKLESRKKRTRSSRSWLTRQLNDPYVQRAKAEGYRSRAAFKLVEIDQKFRIFKKNRRVLDLGAAPGGWSQVAAAKVGSGGYVLAVDLQDIAPLPGVECIRSDFAEVDWSRFCETPFDVIVSDMAAPACGIPSVDHLRIMGLLETALDLAQDHLAAGGHFVAKVLRGGAEANLLQKLRKHFAKVQHFKPPSSRSDSAEMYLVAMGWKGCPGRLIS